MTTLRDEVFEALDRGVVNAPEISTWDSMKLTCDLLDCDSFFDECSISSVLPHVAEWLNQRKTK